MSVIDLAVAKEYLDVIHNADDTKLQMLLDGAEDEAAQYMNRQGLSGPWCEWEPAEGASGIDTIPPSVVLGIMLLLQAAYQATPDDAEKLRRAAEIKLNPYRCGWGV